MTSETRRILLQIFLFLATFVTTTIAGASFAFGKDIFMPDYSWADFVSGMEFSIPLLLFLTVHEFGHYFTAVYHKVKTSLPYYIPIPPIPFLLNIGTLGAVIRIRSKPTHVQHFDIGLAGPLAGFIMTLAILVYGFSTLPPADYIFSIHPEYKAYGQEYRNHVYEQEYFNTLFATDSAHSVPDSLHTSADSVKTDGRYFINMKMGTNLMFKIFEFFVDDPNKIPDPHELMHYPVLLAGFFALFFTCLNLLPIGQLDGGHVIYGMFGFARHRIIASIFFVALLLYGGLGLEFIDIRQTGDSLIFGIVGYVLFLYIALTGLKLPRKDTAMFTAVIFATHFALLYFFPLVRGNVTWLVFAFIVSRLGVPHPVSEFEHPLDSRRLLLGWIILIVFILCFSPSPVDAVVVTAQP